MPRFRSIATLSVALLAASVSHALNEGMATYFLGVGYPYGACGVPDSIAALEGAMDTLTGQANPFDYVALNVYNTPGVYTQPAPHPMTGSDTIYRGAYDDGRNCGRWIRFTLGDTCDGKNDGAKDQPFCREGTGWHPNEYTGSGGYAVVFDQCTDGNAWCRDSRWHVDLHAPVLSHLRKDGVMLPPLATPVLDANGKPQADPNNPWAVFYQVQRFQNPQIAWEFVPAPNYQGEPRFWFSQASKAYYQRIIVTHLPNGIHGLQQLVDGAWKDASMEEDRGQMWLMPDQSVTRFTVRIRDAHDQLVMGGRTWTFDYPSSCKKECAPPATAAANVTGQGGEVSVQREGVHHAMQPRVLADGFLSFPGGNDGWIELVKPSGRAFPRQTVRGGKVRLPIPGAGVWIAHWNVGGLEGRGTIVAR